jgi:hypothetical protein
VEFVFAPEEVCMAMSVPRKDLASFQGLLSKARSTGYEHFASGDLLTLESYVGADLVGTQRFQLVGPRFRNQI